MHIFELNFHFFNWKYEISKDTSVYFTRTLRLYQFDDEVPVTLEVRGMWSTPSFLSLPGPLWIGVVAPDRILSMRQIELNYVLVLKWIAWNRIVLTFKLHIYAKLNCLK